MYDGPVLDNHLHLDPINGQGVDAAETFAAAGGTHLNVLNKPSWDLVGAVEGEAGFRETFDLTVEVTRRADECLPGRARPVLGVHPGLVSRLTERGYDPDEAVALMKTGIDVAAEYVAEGPALAIKSGRPHYEVEEAVWEASNEVMRHAFARAASVGCAVQLHTEGGEEFETLIGWAEAEGLAPDRVVKHYAGGYLEGPVPSVISKKEKLERACGNDRPFLMETDFIDDPDRPGAVLGPRTVPRRTRWLAEAGYERALYRAHVETPAAVYGIDTEATLSDDHDGGL